MSDTPDAPRTGTDAVEAVRGVVVEAHEVQHGGAAGMPPPERICGAGGGSDRVQVPR